MALDLVTINLSVALPTYPISTASFSEAIL
jgi:hypothetical protein